MRLSPVSQIKLHHLSEAVTCTFSKSPGLEAAVSNPIPSGLKRHWASKCAWIYPPPHDGDAGQRGIGNHFVAVPVVSAGMGEARLGKREQPEMVCYTLGGTARQPDSPTARQPDSPTARQPDSPTARQPDSPTARQPDSPTARQPDSPTARQPDSPTARQPDSPTARQPDSPTARQPDSPTARQPDSPTARQPDSPTARQPDSPTARQPDSPTARQPDSPTARQPDSPTARQPDSPTARQPDSPTARQPDSPTARQPDSPTARQPDSPTARQPDSPTARQPDSPTARQPDSPTARQPDSPTARQPDSPTARQPDSPTARQPDSPTARQPDSPTARQPDSPTARHLGETGGAACRGVRPSTSASSRPAPIPARALAAGRRWAGAALVTLALLILIAIPSGSVEAAGNVATNQWSVVATKGGVKISWAIRNQGLVNWIEVSQESGGGSFSCTSGGGNYFVPPINTNSQTIRGSCFHTTVVAGTRYGYSISTWAGVGSASRSGTKTVTAIALSVPDEPTNFAATAGHGQVTLSWGDPNDPSIQRYQYQQKSAGGGYPLNWTTIPNSDHTTVSYVVPNLTSGTAYTFRIRAVNNRGGRATLAEETATPTTPPVPAKPTSFTATAGDQQVALAWTDPSDSTITGWEVRYKVKTGSDGDWTEILNSQADTTSHTVTGLINGTEYRFQVRAVNATGDGTPSDPEDATPVTHPMTVTRVIVTPGDGQLRVSWAAPTVADSSSDSVTIQKYEVFYKSEATPADGDWNSGGTVVPPATREVVISSLVNGTKYTIIVVVTAADSQSYESAYFSATPVPPAPATPTGFIAKSGDAEVRLVWDNPKDATITKWQYQQRVGESGIDFGSWKDIPGSDKNTVSYTVTGLTNGVFYVFQLRAVNMGDHTDLPAGAGTVTMAAPARPTNFAATAGDAQVVLSWTNPQNSDIREWQYQQKVGTGSYGDWTEILNSQADTTSYTVTGLTPGTRYTFKLRAVNIGSTAGSPSDAASATPPAKAPAKPDAPTLTPGNTQLTVSWTEPATNGAAITDYDVRYKLSTASDSAWAEWNDTDTSTTIGATITGLDNGTRYDVQVRATNSVGDSDWSDATSATPVPQVPSKPGAPTLTVGNTQLTVAWDAPANNGAAISDYDVRHKLTSDIDIDSNWTEWNASNNSTTRSATITGLANGTSYDVQVRATNSVGDSDWSDATSATPAPVPAQPDNFAAAPRHQSVYLSWDDPSDSTITEWQVRYKVKTVSNYGNWTRVSTSAGATSHTVTSLTNGTEYNFQLRALNPSGNGAPSAAQDATPAPVPAQPDNFAAAPRHQSVYLSWDDPSDSTITEWQVRYKVKTVSNYGNWTRVSTSAGATSHTVTSLTNGTEYNFQLRALNPSGNGAPSAAQDATPAPVPAQPDNFAAAPRHQSVYLSWDDPSDSTITEWQVRYKVKTVSNYGNWTRVSTSAGATSHTVTSLTNGTEYNFQLRALNPSGNGAPSAAQDATPAPVPAQPDNFAAAPRHQSVYLSWDDPSDSTITEWQVRYKVKTVSNYGNWTRVSTSAGATSHTVTSLTNGTEYNFQLRALNPSGNGAPSAAQDATPAPVPAQPDNFAAAPRHQSVYLSWDDPSDSTITEWQVRYKVKTVSNYGNWTRVSTSAGATSHTVTSLTNGTEYNFQLRALNPSGNGAPSAAQDATPAPVPAQPDNFAAAPRHQSVYLSWDDPSDSTITEWQVRYKVKTVSNYGNWTRVSTSAGATSHTVTSLTNGTEYNFQLRALNPSGNGAPSAAQDATPAPVPAQPDNFAAAPRHQSVYLSWDDPSDSTITEWQVRYKVKTVSNYGNWTRVSTSAGATSHTVTSLTNGTEYNFQLRALNPSGNGAPSAAQDATPAPVPAQPDNFAAAPRHQSVYLSWDDPSDSTITEWQVRYKVKTVSNYGNWTRVSTSAGATSHTVTSLTNGTEYNFQLRALNPSGNGAPSAAQDATPAPVPAQPDNFAAAPRHQSVYLSWDDPSDSTITEWQVRYKVKTVSNYGNWTRVSTSAGATSHTVTSLTNGTEYNFQLRALNPSGNGAPSAAQDATPAPVPAQPDNFAAAPRHQSVYLSWDDPSDSTITEWQVRYKVKTVSNYGNWTRVSTSAGATSHTVTSLTNGTEYNFQLRALNPSGNGAPSAAQDATPAPVPAQPDNFAAAPRHQSVYLSWDDPSDSTITEWQVRYKVKTVSNYGNWTRVSTSAGATSHTVTSLTNGTEYNFQLRALNPSGNGAPSAAQDATPAPVPAQPDNFAAAPRHQSVYLSWDDPSDSTITEWQVRYKVKTVSNYGNWTRVSTSAGATSHTVTSLTNGTEYNFQLRALNPSGNGAPSAAQDATPAPVPAQPDNFAAAPRHQSVYLSWDDPSDSTITEWQVRYKVKTVSNYGNWTRVSTSAGATSHTVTSLTNGTEYNFQLRALNPSGNGAPSAAQDATPAPVPAQPDNFAAAPRHQSVYLSWDDPSDSTITEWQVRYKVKTVSNYGNWTRVSTSAGATSHTVTSLTNGTEYNFQLRALNPSGNGAPSAAQDATPAPVPAQPDNFAAAPRHQSVYLSWDDPSDSTITEWQVRYKVKTVSNYGNWTRVSTSAGATSHTVTSLTNGTEYNFQLRALNPSGNGAPSAAQDATPAPVPAQPDNFAAAPRHQSVYLSWDDPSDSTITEWQVRYKVKTVSNYGNWTRVSTSAGATSHTVTSLTNGTEYNFQLRALNPSGNGAPSAAQDATPAPVPAQPDNFAAAPRHQSVYLSWDDPSDSTITEWQVRYKVKTVSNYGNWTRVSTSAGATSHTVTSLTNGTEYNFQLRALNPSGNGAPSAAQDATPAPVPAQPDNFAAAPRHQSVYLSWDDPSDSTITEWQVRYKVKTVSNYGNWTRVSTSAGATSHTVTSLTNGTEYNFQLRALNPSGNGAPSAAQDATPAPVPAQPDNFAAAPRHQSVYLSWDDPSDSTITEWQVRYKVKTVSNYGNWTRVSTSAGATSHTVTSLTNGTEYNFQLRALNPSGNGAPSAAQDATPAPVPAQPDNFAAAPRHQSVYLSWDDPSDSTITEWQVRYKVKTVSNYGNWTRVSTSAGATSHTVTSLTNGTEYNFQLRALNPSGNGAPSAAQDATPAPVPAQPDNFAAAPRHQSVYLSWDDPSDSTITEWQVRYKVKTVSNYGNWTRVSTSAGATSHTVTSLTNGTEYNFQLRALNPSGNGAPSAAQDATPAPVPAQPDNFAAAPRHQSVYLSWDDPSDSTITEWQVRYKVKTVSNYGNWTRVSTSAGATSHTVTSLTNGTEYNFQLRALNPSGNGAPSAAQDATPAPVPAQPDNFAAAPRHQSVYLSWDDPSDSTITEWQVRYKVKTVSNYGNWTRVSTSAGATSHTVTSLTNGTEYNFQLRALNPSGNGAPSAAQDATPAPVPAQPDNFAAAPRHQSVYLSWDDPSDSTITEWQVRYKVKTVSNYGNWTRVSTSAGATSHTVTSLTNGTEYNFQLRALNPSGNGAPSAVQDATPAPADTAAPTVTFSPADGDKTGDVNVNVEVRFNEAVRKANGDVITDSNAHLLVTLTPGDRFGGHRPGRLEDGPGYDVLAGGRGQDRRRERECGGALHEAMRKANGDAHGA